MDALNAAWNAVASKMYESAKTEGEPQQSSEPKSTSKKDGDEIEDADFEVVD